MIKQDKRDIESFIKEQSLESLKNNNSLNINDIVLVADTGSFYKITNVENDLPLSNSLFAEEIKKEQLSKLKKYSYGLLGKYDGLFPLIYAKKDCIYLLKSTNKFYRCIEDYNDPTTKLSAPNKNFVLINEFDNERKLSNVVQNIKTYKTFNEAIISKEPYITVGINNEIRYIGLTKDIDTPKASLIKYDIDGEIYALRKYTNKLFPDNLKNLETITQDMVPDLSDIESMYGVYWDNNILKNADVIFDTRNCINFMYAFRNAPNLIISPHLDTSKGKFFDYMYNNCSSLLKSSDIDLTSITLEDITINKKLINMFRNCNSLVSVTFNNVPQGITVDNIRTATSTPITCEIILNYRNS